MPLKTPCCAVKYGMLSHKLQIIHGRRIMCAFLPLIDLNIMVMILHESKCFTLVLLCFCDLNLN